MTFDSFAKYSDESIQRCKDLCTFLKKKTSLDIEHAKAVAKLCTATLQPSSTILPLLRQSSKDTDNDTVFKTSVWSTVDQMVSKVQETAVTQRELAENFIDELLNPFQVNIREMEIVRKQIVDEESACSKHLQEFYTAMKKCKQTFDEYQQQLQEATEQKAKAERASKTKDIEKASIKLASIQVKVQASQEALRNSETNCKIAQAEYFQKMLPTFYESLHLRESDRCNEVLKVLTGWYEWDRHNFQIDEKAQNFVIERLHEIDIVGDISDIIDEHCLNNESGTDALDVSVRSILNPFKSGRLLLLSKSGSTWKKRFFVLVGNLKYSEEQETNVIPRLYCFDGEDALRAKKIINISTASVHDLHCSLSKDQQHIFQITAFGTRDENGICPKTNWIFSASNANDKAEWIKALKNQALCCEKCAVVAFGKPINLSLCANTNLFRYNSSSGGERYRLMRSLHVSVLEARNIPSSFVNYQGSDQFMPLSIQRTNMYCEITVNDTLVAKTSPQPVIRSSISWSEDFESLSLNNCYEHIKFSILYFSKFSRRNIAFGSAEISLTQISEASDGKWEGWINLQTPTETKVDDGKIPGIRVSVTLVEEEILPLQDYSYFAEDFFRNDFAHVQVLSELAIQKTILSREDFARSFVYFLISTGKDVEVLKTALATEVARTEDPNIIFRGNSLGTKSLDQYMKVVGMPYLHRVLSAPLRFIVERVLKRLETVEIDPTRLEEPTDEIISQNAKRLLGWCQLIWDAIVESIPKCPPEIRVILRDVRQHVETTFSGSKELANVRFSAISGFIFLRFFCPCILNPSLFGMAKEIHLDHDIPPDQASNLNRTFTLIAKLMQNLANLNEFKGKEAHMELCNKWLRKNADTMRACLLEFSTTESNVKSSNVVLEVDLSRELNKIYQVLKGLYRDIEANGKVDVSKSLALQFGSQWLSESISKLTEFYAKYREVYENQVLTIAKSASFKTQLSELALVHQPISGAVKRAVTRRQRTKNSVDKPSSPVLPQPVKLLARTESATFVSKSSESVVEKTPISQEFSTELLQFMTPVSAGSVDHSTNSTEAIKSPTKPIERSPLAEGRMLTSKSVDGVVSLQSLGKNKTSVSSSSIKKATSMTVTLRDEKDSTSDNVVTENDELPVKKFIFKTIPHQ